MDPYQLTMYAHCAFRHILWGRCHGSRIVFPSLVPRSPYQMRTYGMSSAILRFIILLLRGVPQYSGMRLCSGLARRRCSRPVTRLCFCSPPLLDTGKCRANRTSSSSYATLVDDPYHDRAALNHAGVLPLPPAPLLPLCFHLVSPCRGCSTGAHPGSTAAPSRPR